MKTPMQLHSEWLKEQLQELYDDNRAGSYTDVFREKIFLSSIKHAESLLEKERHQIKEAFLEGSLSWATGSNSDEYYNETYGEQ